MRSIALFCPILFFVAQLGAIQAKSEDQIVGQIVVVNGSADSIYKSQTHPLKPGDSIKNVETIKTHVNSSVKILFTDQTSIDLGPNSSFQVSDYALKGGDNRTGNFSLFYGKMRSLITKKVSPQGKVNFRSGGTVMGVRGTEFIVDTQTSNGAAAGQSSIVVVNGVVEVSSMAGGPPVALKAGEMITANIPTTNSSSSGGAANSSSTTTSSKGSSTSASSGSGGMTVSKVSTTQMTSMVQSSKTQDNTFKMSVQIQPTEQSGTGQSNQGPSLAMNTVGNLVSGAMQVQQNTMQENPIQRNTPEFLNQPPINTPPVQLIPGGVVNLQVTVQ